MTTITPFVTTRQQQEAVEKIGIREELWTIQRLVETGEIFVQTATDSAFIDRDGTINWRSLGAVAPHRAIAVADLEPA